MNAVHNRTPHKRRWFVSFLLPVGLLIFGRAFLVTACSQESVATRIVLTEGTPTAPQPANGKAKAALELRSLAHPFPQVSEVGAIDRSVYSIFGQSSFPVAAGEKAVWYSKAVNQINASLLLPNVTWLATEFGLKRLDNRSRTVQHFCVLDGLPYDRITALAGRADQQLYCSAEQTTIANARRSPNATGLYHSAVALCRYHADSGKWVVVATEVRSYPPVGRVSQADPSKAQNTEFYYAGSERQYVTVGGGHACVVLGPGIPGQSIALLSPVKGGAAAKILCPSFANDPFRIFFAHADTDNLWIGSDLGLLRYAFKAHRWERLLPDLVVTGGCPAEQGGLWLLTRRFDSAPQDQDGHHALAEHCWITHFVQGKSPEHFALPDQENFGDTYNNIPSYANLFAAGDRVWTTPQPHGMMTGSYRDGYPPVFALHVSTGKLDLDVPPGSEEHNYASVPDVVLANAETYRGIPVPFRMPARFPGWICVPEEDDRFRPVTQGFYAYDGSDDADERWDTYRTSGSDGSEGRDSRQVLERRSRRGEERESYTVPAMKNLDLWVAAVDPNAVWAIGNRSDRAVKLPGVDLDNGVLVRFDRKEHTWSSIPMPEGVSISNGAQWSVDGTSGWLQTYGDPAWLPTPADTYRLDIKTNRWENISSRLAYKQGKQAFQQVAPDGEDVWLVAATTDEHGVPLSHPPAIPLYRYHVKTDTFVPVRPSSGKPLLSHLLTVNRDSLLLATSEGSFRFDRATQRWKPLPSPALPAGLTRLNTLAIYEEAGSYWFVGADNSLNVKE